MKVLCIDSSGDSSPGVELVDGSIHPHGDGQGFLPASLSHQVDHASEPCAAHMGRASGNTLTDQTHNVTVQLWGQNAQRGEDVVDLFSVPCVAGRKKKNEKEVHRCTKQIMFRSILNETCQCNILHLNSSKRSLHSRSLHSPEILLHNLS